MRTDLAQRGHRGRPMLRRFGLAAAALFGAAAAVGGAVSAASAAQASQCDAHNVVVWLQGPGDAAAGSSNVTLALTNLSGRACTLRGYPGLSAVDLAAQQLGSPADRNPQSAVRKVRIPAGGSARVQLRINHPGVFPPNECRPVTAAGLRVYLPGATEARTVPFPFGACSRQGRTYLHVSAVTS